MQGVARGADVNAPLHLSFADAIMQEANAAHAPSHPEIEFLHSTDLDVSLIFAACKVSPSSQLSFPYDACKNPGGPFIHSFFAAFASHDL